MDQEVIFDVVEVIGGAGSGEPFLEQAQQFPGRQKVACVPVYPLPSVLMASDVALRGQP